MSWNQLSKKELLRTLDEDFAFELKDDEKVTKDTILVAVSEGGLKFTDYLRANPAEAEKYKTEPEKPVTGADLAAALTEPVPSGEAPTPLVAQAPVQVNLPPAGGEAPWLVKMERKNGTFQVGKYIFTREHPYVVVESADVSRVLKEGGFRQAYPEELAEFYG